MNTDHVAPIRKGRGRPKQFDREDALDKALELFWRHGYEATSLTDLVEATGAKAPTLYGEFGNKEGLFRAAAERYVAKFAERGKALLADPECTVAQAAENFMRDTAALYTDKDLPSGCFIICTSAALSSSSDEVAKLLRARHHFQENMLGDFLRARQAKGELSADSHVPTLAKYLTCILQGMSVQARDGATREDLDTIVSTLMKVWPNLTRIGAAGVRNGVLA
ncbi:TetR/AcrR family transcriptional regulator [Acerihabitans arboris]|uniref:TetR family transcriptional regulator n=1 Tax=Acerihabitans arboris TaxID=2691583 RepID=A0A845SDT6_9GAMM|nr:TetR/AcrR family transcriptional regulator [Acerihabitans arboris]NDL61537.1 TetR family transcriptional regulator [Acerihabitans arboris]